MGTNDRQQIHPALLKPEKVPLDELNLDPSNARVHEPESIEAIRLSMHRFGQRKAIVVQREGMIVRAGNGTLRAARDLKWDALACTVIDESDTSAMEYAIADNRSAEKAWWDKSILERQLEVVEDPALLGFTPADLGSMFGNDLWAPPGGADGSKSGNAGVAYTEKITIHLRDVTVRGEIVAALTKLLADGGWDAEVMG